jgi:hypothetical protein
VLRLKQFGASGSISSHDNKLSRGASLLLFELNSLLQQQPALTAMLAQYQKPIRAALLRTSDDDVRSWLQSAREKIDQLLTDLDSEE